MSGIAEVLLDLGYEVTGSDLAESEITRRLGELGADVHLGHRAENVGDADVVVVSSAVQARQPRGRGRARARHPGDPARRDARRADAPEVRRRDRRLARQDHDHVAGRRRAARRPGSTRPWSSAASVNALGSNANARLRQRLPGRRGRRERRLVPQLTPDDRGRHQHRRRAPRPLRHASSSVKDAFVDFANRVPFYGLVRRCASTTRTSQAILPRLHEALRDLRRLAAGRLPRRATSATTGSPPASACVAPRPTTSASSRCTMPGAHNVLNALAAIAVATSTSCSFAAVARGAGRVRRRPAPLHRARRRRRRHGRRRLRPPPGRDAGHPRRRARQLPRAGGIVAAFQPHRYTRARDHLDGVRRASTPPTWSCSPTSTPPARRRSPASPSRRSWPPCARAGPAAASSSTSRSRGPGRVPGPTSHARRPGHHARRRQHHPASAASSRRTSTRRAPPPA